MAEKQHSNTLLGESIEAYLAVLSWGSTVPDQLFMLSAERCISRMRFRGLYVKAVGVHRQLIKRFPKVPSYRNQLAVTYLMINKPAEAKVVLEEVLAIRPDDGFAKVHYGFILKTTEGKMEKAVSYLSEGIASREEGTLDGRFFFHLGDALVRLGKKEQAMKLYEAGVKEGLFRSKYQRSLYNVNRLKSHPWWTPEQTTYAQFFKRLEDSWEVIRKEGTDVLSSKMPGLFKDEAESLQDKGNWKQFELFARGRMIPANCELVPQTCKLIAEFPAAFTCKRGQVKFSVMQPGTHVWPHCGPTNCRLRAHLGLVVPEGTWIRVAEETRTWKEGKFIIFDDSFEHEVWHNGTGTRLVLIVDVWHPDLTESERSSLPAI